MRFQVTPEDFMKGGLPEVGWHPSKIAVWDESGVSKSEKNPGSQYTKVEFEIVVGPSKGKRVFTNFSEVAPAFIVPLLEAVSKQQVDKTKTFQFETSKASMEGKLVDIHLIPGSYNNKPKREIDGYRPYTGPIATVTTEAGV